MVLSGYYMLISYATNINYDIIKVSMDDNKILELTGKIEETLGKENSAMISDTLGEILTGNAENLKAIAERDEKIKTLQDRNEKLVSANGALLQKIPMEKAEDKVDSEKEAPKKKISFKDIFDKKGNFLK